MIVDSVNLPLFFNLQVFIEDTQKIVAGHDSAGEKVAAHPVGFTFRLKMVRIFLMRKNMDEEFSLRLQPLIDPAKKFFIVLHVFKHFN